MAELNDPIVPPPAPCTPSLVIDGDVNVDISTEDINELVDKICDCIEQQTTDLCECIAAAAEAICECIANIPPPPIVVPLACQPCIAVNGVLDPQAMIVIIDGVPTYYNATGEIPASSVEVLDPCDPRCNAPCECGEPFDIEECCEQECDPADFQALANAMLDKPADKDCCDPADFQDLAKAMI